MRFLFDEKYIIAAIVHSKRRSLYGSAYRWIVNTLTLTKSRLGIVRLVRLVLCIEGTSGVRHQSNQLPTTVANNLIELCGKLYSLAWQYGCTYVGVLCAFLSLCLKTST